MVIVELFDLNLPLDCVGRAVLDLDGKVATVVETAELGRRDRALLDSTGLGGNYRWPLNSFVKGGDLAARALTLLGERLGRGSGSGGGFCSSNNAGLSNAALLSREVRLGEVSEDRVLGSRKQLVVRGLEGLRASLGEKLREVVLDGKTTRNRRGFAHSLS